METPFYHDAGRSMKQSPSLKCRREPEASPPSPDLGFLKLASPDLERLIIQSSGLVTTSPGPPPGPGSRGVTDEQNSFAEGFVKALEDLHKQNQLGGSPGTGPCPGPCPGPPPPVYTDLSPYSGATGPGRAYSPGPGPKDEPQTVPEVPGLADSPPLSPINMDTQERIKAERKRLRNRIAASKCRKRKLERISRLEDKVKSLKCQNSELASTAGLLREQVAQLKQKVLSHVNSGCQLLLAPQVQAY
uniref:transcription factor JunD-like n=1 Tax=Pristiophorus japonicus TaxID=55135 RepID=UPI00398EFFE9